MDPQHHHKLTPSVLETVGIGMVSQFPADAMHLIDLGIVKKLLSFLLKEIPSATERVISKIFVEFGLSYPLN